MAAMEKMLASMLGITAEDLQKMATDSMALIKTVAERLDKMENDLQEIKNYLMPAEIPLSVKELENVENDD